MFGSANLGDQLGQIMWGLIFGRMFEGPILSWSPGWGSEVLGPKLGSNVGVHLGLKISGPKLGQRSEGSNLGQISEGPSLLVGPSWPEDF